LAHKWDLTDLVMLYLAVGGLLIVVTPGLLIGAAVYLVLTATRSPKLVPLLFAVVALPAAVLSAVLFPQSAADLGNGYLDAQTLGIRAATAQINQQPADWQGYGLALLPYGLVVGLLLGALAYSFPLLRLWAAKYLKLGEYKPMDRLKAYGATDLRRALAKTSEVVIVKSIAAIGRITAIPSLPKRGKSKALGGLFKAFQDGTAWFGLWVMGRCQVFVASEEDPMTFAGRMEEFGLTSTTVRSMHLPEVNGWLGPERWDALLDRIFQMADDRKLVVVDTLTSWAPWAFRGGPELMSFCLSRLKAKAQQHKKAVIVVLHNRKSGGGDDGAVVGMLGSVAGAAAYDVICEFDRDKATGVCTLSVEGRLSKEAFSVSARLDGVQYVPIPDEDKGEDDEEIEAEEKRSQIEKDFMVALKAASRTLTQSEMCAILGKQQPNVSRAGSKLASIGLIVVEGKGGSKDPKRYRLPLEGEAVEVVEAVVVPAGSTPVSAKRAEVAARRNPVRRPARGV